MDRYKIRRERKEILKKEIEEIRNKIQEEDYKLMSIEEGGSTSKHDDRLIELNKELNTLKDELQRLRLEGDKFYVMSGEDLILIEIDEFSKLSFYLCKQFLDISSISLQTCNESRIHLVNEEEIKKDPDNTNLQPIYETQTSISTRPIYQLLSVKTNFDTPSSLSKPSLFERVKQNTWSLGISPLRRTTSDPTIFGERFSPPKSISNFIEKFKDNKDKDKEQQEIKYSTTTAIVSNGTSSSSSTTTTTGDYGKILLTWHNKETSMYILKSQEESIELLELLGSHIDRSKKIIAKQTQTIKMLYQKKSTLYDSNNPEHEEYLKQLWNLLFPGEEFQKKSPLWKQFGFQSDDPSRDFRGMGIMGLLNLTYLVEHHFDWVYNILKEDRDYPFAVAGINISNLIFEVFQINEESVQQPWYSSLLNPYMAMLCSMSRNNNSAFDELYFLIFKLLDHVWTQMNATYMMFPLVLKKLKSLLNEISQLNPNSFDEVKAKFDLIIISNIITPEENINNNLYPQLPSSPRSPNNTGNSLTPNKNTSVSNSPPKIINNN
ncbi:hypothetical protein DICPUDRAFT_50960, partial [Dictyostelium purpureum]